MSVLVGLLELLMRAAREAKSTDIDADGSDQAILEDMAADDAEEEDIEEEEAGG